MGVTGYLRGDIAETATRLGCSPKRIEPVIARLQELDPPGVFARDLPECLALQLRDRNRLDPAMQTLLDNLPLLAARNTPALLRLCQVDADDFAEMVNENKVKKFEITSRHVIIYLGDVRPGDELHFEYSLRARFPLRAQTAGVTHGVRPSRLVIRNALAPT